MFEKEKRTCLVTRNESCNARRRTTVRKTFSSRKKIQREIQTIFVKKKKTENTTVFQTKRVYIVVDTYPIGTGILLEKRKKTVKTRQVRENDRYTYTRAHTLNMVHPGIITRVIRIIIYI